MFWTRPKLLPVIALALIAATLLSGCSQPAVAAPETPEPERTITVIGRGSASARPDLALANLGVETFADTVGKAVEENNARMTAVLAKLKELGIADKDVQTSNFSINLERRDYEPSGGTYRVSNMVQVKVRDVKRVGEIIDAVVAAGVNQVWGVSFAMDDQNAFEADARAKAMEDARKRAEALADLANVEVGQVLKVDENWMPTPIFGGGAGAAGDTMATAISPGEVTVSYQVQVTFAIE